MVEGLDDSKVKWLTYLVYFLLVVLSAVTGFNTYLISEIPKEYVRLERYKEDTKNWLSRYTSDIGVTRDEYKKLDTKLDKIVELITRHMIEK